MIINFLILFSLTMMVLFILNLINQSFLSNIIYNFIFSIILILFLEMDFLSSFSFIFFINIFFAFLFSGLSHSVSLKMLELISKNNNVDFEKIRSEVVIPSFEYRYDNLIKKKIINVNDDSEKEKQIYLNHKKLYLINFLILIRELLNIKNYG